MSGFLFFPRIDVQSFQAFNICFINFSKWPISFNRLLKEDFLKVTILLSLIACFSSQFAFAQKKPVAPSPAVVKTPPPPAPAGKYNQNSNGGCRDLPGHSVCGIYCCINNRWDNLFVPICFRVLNTNSTTKLQFQSIVCSLITQLCSSSFK
jgi:hypothetical protein